MLEFALQAFVLLLVVIDPFGLTPIFSALTARQTPWQRRQTAIKGVVISAGVMAFFTFGGVWLLDYLGIGMPAFRIAGGILLAALAIQFVIDGLRASFPGLAVT